MVLEPKLEFVLRKYWYGAWR